VTAVEKRRKHARTSLVAWYAQIAPALALSGAAALLGGTWEAVLLVYVTALSVWTGIESAHARLNADLPTEDDDGR
jgi:hypothetical protein